MLLFSTLKLDTFFIVQSTANSSTVFCSAVIIWTISGNNEQISPMFTGSQTVAEQEKNKCTFSLKNMVYILSIYHMRVYFPPKRYTYYCFKSQGLDSFTGFSQNKIS